MIVIDEATLRAMEADVERRTFGSFAAWWGRHGLPSMSAERLAALWRHAREQAAEIGIEDDRLGRISLYAAAFGLMGDLDGIRFLQVSDILFLDEPVDHRLARIVSLARTSR